ncbi:Type 2 DNA topoisomerase 6 subunit B [uncultured archaeon]|nr:Type 2 DNA topoisomerase 6 subunit B [uncultured archaeon]
MLGYSSKVRSLTTIVHEFVTNSLYSCEEGGILPEITVTVTPVSAQSREDVLGIGDGTTRLYEIPFEIYDADMLEIQVGGFNQTLKRDYEFKTEKKGKEAVRFINFKNSPAAGSKVAAKWAHAHLKVTVEDNGTGIPASKIGNAFGQLLSGTKFAQRKQKRGQQGIGASYAVLFAQLTTGKPTHVKTGIGDGRVHEADVSVDAKANKPLLAHERDYSGKYRGVKVECEFAEVTYNRSEYGTYEYLRRSALANPHAQLTLVEPDNNVVVFPRASTKVPVKPQSVLPHPLGITTSDFMDIAHQSKSRKVSSMLTSEFAAFTNERVAELDELTKAGGQAPINFDKAPLNLSFQEAERMVRAFQKIKFVRSVEDNALVPIGDEQIEKSLKNLLAPEKLKVVERKPKFFRGGIPFLVEAAVAFGGKAGAGGADAQNAAAVSTSTASTAKLNKDGEIAIGRAGLEILRYSNRTPLLFDSGTCAITQAVKEIDWTRYDLKDLENQPVSIFVNFVSVYVPYTGAGKLAISAEEDIVTEIKLALQDCARDVSVYLHSLAKAADQEARRKLFFNYLGEVAEALHDITGKPKEKLIAQLRIIAEERTRLMEAQDAAGQKDEDEELEDVGALEEDV